MDGEAAVGFGDAEDDVEGHPGERSPPGPVAAAEKKDAEEKREELGKLNPENFGTGAAAREEFVTVADGANDADRDIQDRDDSDRERALSGRHGKRVYSEQSTVDREKGGGW